MGLQSLKSYLPKDTDQIVMNWLNQLNIELKITGPRQSKLGDFRAEFGKKQSRMTINGDLKPLQFLITLTHEIAHAQVWQRYVRRVAPHGPQWQKTFGALLIELTQVDSLPQRFRAAIYRHALSPTSSTGRDPELMRVLRSLEPNGEIWLDELAIGTVFEFRGQRFKKLKSNRTRCKCLHIKKGQHYTIAKTAPVKAEGDDLETEQYAPSLTRP